MRGVGETTTVLERSCLLIKGRSEVDQIIRMPVFAVCTTVFDYSCALFCGAPTVCFSSAHAALLIFRCKRALKVLGQTWVDVLKKYVVFVDSSSTCVQLEESSCQGTRSVGVVSAGAPSISLADGGNSHADSLRGEGRGARVESKVLDSQRFTQRQQAYECYTVLPARIGWSEDDKHRDEAA